MKNLISKIIFIILILVVFGFLLFNEAGIIKRLDKQSKLDNTISEINKNKSIADSLQTEVDSLRTSKIKIEEVAREKYNFRKKDEVIFDIEKK